MARSDRDAETEVANSVEVLLDVGGISKGLDFLRTREHPVPATTQATSACGCARCPCGADVGLADQIVDLHGGGLAGQAGECPAAVATGEDFGLAVRQKFELCHLNVRSKLKWAWPNGVLAAPQSPTNSSSILQRCDSDVLRCLLLLFSVSSSLLPSGAHPIKMILLLDPFMLVLLESV